MSPNCQCHHNANNTTTKMSPKRKCHQKANVTKIKRLLKWKCHQNANFITWTFVFPNLPNGSGKTKSPDLFHINSNGLPCHGLSDSRLVCVHLSIWNHIGVNYITLETDLKKESHGFKFREILDNQLFLQNWIDSFSKLCKYGERAEFH